MSPTPAPNREATTHRALAFEPTPLALALVFALAVGCNGEGPPIEEECPPEGTELTFENFGDSFMQRHCQQCHGTWVEDRKGAPIGFTFDDAESVRELADRIYARSAAENTSMPPGPDDPDQDERDDLAEWLACGAP